MPNGTSAAASGRAPRRGASAGYRVIIHPPVCPDCGSDDVTDTDVDTGDGMTETARTCRTCGTAWPIACICDWTPADTLPPAP